MSLVEPIECYMEKQHSLRCLFSPLLITSKETLRLGQLIEDHIAQVPCAAYFDPRLWLSSKQTL